MSKLPAFQKEQPILVTGYFKRNLGDDLFLKVLSERYSFNNFEVIIDKKNAKYYRQISNVRFIKKGLLCKVVNKLLKLVSPAGIYSLLKYRYLKVIEIGGSVFTQRKGQRGVDFMRNYLAINSENYFVIGSNFGPFETQEFMQAHRKFFQQITGTVFRDKKTVSLFQGVENVRYAPDVVFNLQTEQIKTVPEKVPYAVITPIDLDFKDVSRDPKLAERKDFYLDSIIKVATQLVDDGFSLKFMVFGEEQNDRGISEVLLNKLAQMRPCANLEIIETENIQKKLEILKNSSRLISTRYHSMILGWLFQVPQLVYIYSDKMLHVIDDLYPTQSYCDIRAESLKNVDNGLFCKMGDVQLASIIKRAALQFSYLDKFLEVKPVSTQ